MLIIFIIFAIVIGTGIACYEHRIINKLYEQNNVVANRILKRLEYKSHLTRGVADTYMADDINELGAAKARGKIVNIIQTTPSGYNAMYDCYLRGIIRTVLNQVIPRSDLGVLNQTGWNGSDHDLIENIITNFMMNTDAGTRVTLMDLLMKAGRGHWNPRSIELVIDTLIKNLGPDTNKSRLTT